MRYKFLVNFINFKEGALYDFDEELMDEGQRKVIKDMIDFGIMKLFIEE